MKPRSDSVWNRLTQEQRAAVEAWLFEENLSYREALERAQKELGVTASLSSLATFYRRLAHERKTRTVEQAVEWLAQSANSEMQLKVMEQALVQSVTVAAYDLSLKPAGELDMDKLTALNKILSDRREHELRRTRLEWEAERAAKVLEIARAKDLRETIQFSHRHKKEVALDNMTREDYQKCDQFLTQLGVEGEKYKESLTKENNPQEPAK